MPSPFPGMDPYLEAPTLWPVFHHQLIAAIYQILLPSLAERYRARVAARSFTTEVPLFTSVLRETHTQEYLEIHDRADGSLVTLIDAPSPCNKLTPVGSTHYLETRQTAEAARANIVEIDLTTQGTPFWEPTAHDLPEHDYTLSISRGTRRGHREIYTASVLKRLPKFKLPLAIDDRDGALDLSDGVRRAYDVGRFERVIDYHAELPSDVQFPLETREAIALWLKDHHLR